VTEPTAVAVCEPSVVLLNREFDTDQSTRTRFGTCPALAVVISQRFSPAGAAALDERRETLVRIESAFMYCY